MSEASLVQTKSWLDSKDESLGLVYFRASEDAGFGRIFVTLTRDVWLDLGEPESITVAVQAGNNFDFS